MFKPRLFMAILIAVFFYVGFLFQKNSYIMQRDGFVFLQRYADVMSWLERNIQEESVILGNEKLSNLIVDYTRHDVYNSGYAVNFFISAERNKHLYYTELFLDGITKNSAKDYFYDNRDYVGGRFFGQYYRYKNGCYGCFSDQILDSLIFDYQNFADTGLVNQIKKYRVDYVVWDKSVDFAWDLNRFFDKKVYENNDIIIYKS